MQEIPPRTEHSPLNQKVSTATMLASVHNQAALVPAVIAHVRPDVQRIARLPAVRQADHVFLVGCGDSLYATLAARLMFDKYSGVRAEPLEALEFSRYLVPYLRPNTVVISVSSGGTTSRPIEAARCASARGAFTIAVSGHGDSPLAMSAHDAIIHNEPALRVPAPADEEAFSLGNYQAALLTLDLLALELGEQRGTLSSAERTGVEDELARVPEVIRQTVAHVEQSVQEYARAMRDCETFYVLGGGPSYATALFSCAKLFEQPQINGVAVELEEWAHEQYFLTRPGTQIFVVMPPGESHDRAVEQIAGARDMGAEVTAIVDSEDAAAEGAARRFAVQGRVSEELCPLTYCIPGQFFATYLADARGRAAFEFISATQYEVNMRQILRSAIRCP